MNILFIDTVHPFLRDQLEKDGHACTDGSRMNRKEILDGVHAFDGVVIRSRMTIDKEMLDAASALKFIARAGAGMEGMDVEYAESRNVVCLNSPEGSRDAVGEHAVGMLLSLLNKLHVADREVREGKWNRESNRGTELKEKTVGIIGYGNMGSSFAEKLSGFGCKVMAYDKYKKKFSDRYAWEASMEEIFEQADILSLHVPLTDETEYLVNEEFIGRFKKNIVIINTARGKILKTSDLVSSLKNGKVTGACLDVMEYEETSFEKFSASRSQTERNDAWEFLIHSDRVVLSPHIAGWTFESHQKISEVLYDKIRKLV
ncbi:MAG: NAD(P)-binding domain-containing protein [Bacteroidetes bacterium]|nr:NAD(P)-binding domain-containing protein [Bacteroidota bacterium]